MDDRTSTGFAEQAEGSDHCTKPFLIRQLLEEKKDKLERKVEEVLWLGRNYAVYRTERSVHVQFSDCPQEEAAQRRRFTEISPELCELRHLTYQLDRNSVFGWRSGHQASSLYHHNMAQALMLVMEDKIKDGKKLALQALNLAVERVTNDNTVRYLRSCLLCWTVILAAGWVLFTGVPASELFVVAAVAGATGAVLSVANRLQFFQLKPCHQSNMNMWMSCSRVGVGLMAGLILFLLAKTILQKHVDAFSLKMEAWEAVAVLGLLGGFAERLIPNLLKQTAGQMESAGTPVQAFRAEAMQSDSAKPQSTG
jgi:hypothetical protein